MYTIGAISLHRTINSLQYPSNRRLQRKSTAIPGLSLNPDARNPRKNLQNIFLYCRNLQQTRNIIIWHDFINNTISTHRSNYNNPATPPRINQIFDPIQNTKLQQLFTSAEKVHLTYPKT